MVAIFPFCLRCCKQLGYHKPASDFRVDGMADHEAYCEHCGNALALLKLLEKHYESNDQIDLINDALTDLRHAADAINHDFASALDISYDHYVEEKQS